MRSAIVVVLVVGGNITNQLPDFWFFSPSASIQMAVGYTMRKVLPPARKEVGVFPLHLVYPLID
jgi:hypothetical protein